MNLEGVLEGILFIQGDEGVTLEDICKILEVDMDKAKELLLKLKHSYEQNNRGVRIHFLGESFKLTTKEEHRAFYQKLSMTPENNTLSPAALEVLAIIAYNAPITRVEVDEMRGLSSDYTMRKLLAKGLIKEAGKSTMPGHPTLYKTTQEFLDYFGLATIEDLPDMRDFLEDESSVEEDADLYQSKYRETEG